MSTATVSLLETLGALVDYPVVEPDDLLIACLIDPALDPEALANLERFSGAVADMSVTDMQEEYTATFDFSPECSLDVGWHLFGDTHERGAFMASLREDMARTGVPESAELPDHLTHILALLARDRDGAPTLAEAVAPGVDAIARALADRSSPYQYLLEAIGNELTALRARKREEVAHT